MGKIDDNDDQIEEVAKLLKQLTHNEDKEEEHGEEVLEFTELLRGKPTHLDISDDENVDYESLSVEIHLEDDVKADNPEKEDMEEEEDMPEEDPSEVEELSEEENLPEEEELPEEENLPEEEELPEEENLSEEEDLPETDDLNEADDLAGVEDLSEDEEDITDEEDFSEEEETVSEPVVKKATAKKKAVRKTSANAPSRTKQVQKVEEPEPVKMPTGKLIGTLVRKSIFCASLGVFFFALTGLLILLWGYYTSQREYDQINDEYVVIGTATAPENSDEEANVVVDVSADEDEDETVPFLDISVDERKLKALNEDYAFYIVIPGTNIQYPVVQGDDNNHYLRYTYSNQENTAGSIQVDYRTDRDTYLQTFNTILHGHNRQDGTMFSDLTNYMDESFRDEYPYIYIIMDDVEYVYEIFAFYEMIPVAVCYNPNTEDMTYLSFIEENNTYTGDIEVTLEDHIISLYTCNDDSSMRYLVHAVLRETYNLS